MTPTTKEQIDPRRGSNLSPMFIAILGWVIDEKLTEPSIAQIAITSDHFVLAMAHGDIGFNQFIGAETDLWRNLRGWFQDCELDKATITVLCQNIEARIQRH